MLQISVEWVTAKVLSVAAHDTAMQAGEGAFVRGLVQPQHLLAIDHVTLPLADGMQQVPVVQVPILVAIDCKNNVHLHCDCPVTQGTAK